MQDERQGGDPEERAFTGAPDMPPQQPDQPREGNEELQRPDKNADEPPAGEAGGNPHGEYTGLPGYGG